MFQDLQDTSIRGDLVEQRRLQTQTELLDRYRQDLEQEKMVITTTLCLFHNDSDFIDGGHQVAFRCSFCRMP